MEKIEATETYKILAHLKVLSDELSSLITFIIA